MRYSDLSQVNRSVATFSQGLLGNWDGIIGSFAFCFWCCWHILHLAIFSWISEPILGQYNTSRARRLDFTMPMWPWWILSNISVRIEVGIRVLPPLRMTPFSSVSLSLKFPKHAGTVPETGLCFWPSMFDNFTEVFQWLVFSYFLTYFFKF